MNRQNVANSVMNFKQEDLMKYGRERSSVVNDEIIQNDLNRQAFNYQ